jgi:hypothetical protein
VSYWHYFPIKSIGRLRLSKQENRDFYPDPCPMPQGYSMKGQKQRQTGGGDGSPNVSSNLCLRAVGRVLSRGLRKDPALQPEET